MGTKYTYDGTTTTSSAGFTKPTLTGSTIANYAYVTEDPYLRVLSAKSGGTFNSIFVGSGGTMYLSGGAKVTSLTIAGANSALVRLSGGGTVNSLTMSGGTYHGYGAVVSNLYISGSANTAYRATYNMYWNAARISGGYVQNVTMNISCGSAVNVTFDKDTFINAAGSGWVSGAWVAGGNILSCVAQNGASIRLRQSGGYVSSTTFNKATLEQYGVGDEKHNLAKDLTFTGSGAKFNNGLTSGNTNYSGGSAINLTFLDQSFMNARNGAVVTNASFDGQSFLHISGGAQVTSVTLNDKSYAHVSGGGLLQSATLTDSSYVTVRSGGVLQSVTIGENCWVTVQAGGNTTSSGGVAIDVTVQNGGNLTFGGGKWQNSQYCQLASRVTVEAGGTVNLQNYALLMDASAGAGATIVRNGNLNGFGGENTNIAKGVMNDIGADFEVVDGIATGMILDGLNANARSAGIIYSGLTVKDGVIVSGGTAYFFEGARIDGLDVYGSRYREAGTSQLAYLQLSGGVGSNLRVGSSGSANIAGKNTVLSNVSAIADGAKITMTGGTVNGLSATASGATVEVTGGTVNGLYATASSGATISVGGATVSNLVINGGAELWTVSGAAAKIYNIDATKGDGTNYPILRISKGAYLSGGSIHDNARIDVNDAVLENVYFGSNTWNNIYVGGSVYGGIVDGGADLRLAKNNARIVVSGTLVKGNGKINVRDSRAQVKNVVVSGGDNAQINVSAGVVTSATIWRGNILLNGGSDGAPTILGSSAVAEATLVRSRGIIYQSGGTMTNTLIYRGGSGLYIRDPYDYDGVTVQSNLTIVGCGSSTQDVSSGTFAGYIYGGLVSGGYFRNATMMLSGGTTAEVNFDKYTWINCYTTVELNDCVASGGAVVRGRGATINNLTLTDNAKFELSAGVANDVTLTSGASMYVSGGAVLTGVTASDGGIVRIFNGATATDANIKAGGTMYISGTAKVTGITAEAGALISLDLSNKVAGSGNFDTLANVGRIDIINYNPTSGAYTLADEGNTALKVGIVGSRVFDGEVAAGSSWVNPLIAKQFNLNAAGTELGVSAYTRTSTGAAATFAQSGTVINDGDKELQWEVASIANPVTLIEAATTVAKNAWLDIHTCTASSGAAIFGVAKDVDFAGKVSYQLHGGNKLANVAFGADYGGSVKGVDILSYNTEYTGVGYAGGFGSVGEEGIEVVFASNCALDKDFYAGALANYAKTGERTSVSSIRASFGESAGQVGIPAVKGNFYGGGAVKAGNFETTAATNPLQTVGDITVTLNQAAMDDGKCVFAGGYATGHDTAKLAPVYTVDSVTVNINGGTWGAVRGGRGIFGGAMASDNTANGNSGVYAKVGDVDITIAGGTMGNVYGGGWAQKGARSEVGDVSITITGGTITNVFGGGSTSTTEGSGGSTVAGDVTITVSGGTISGDIFAMGQGQNDAVASASVIFTGNKAFSCGVYGYSYVGGGASDATLAFNDYTGTFSGAIGGFEAVKVEANSWMTLGTAAADVSNTAWTFDFEERDLGLDGQAALTWSTADFSDDTITLKIVSTRSEGWTLVSGAAADKYNTAANAFVAEIDGTATSLTFDSATGKTDTIADGDYAGWGFAVENSVLKFTKLA